jgi:hypothetical protein
MEKPSETCRASYRNKEIVKHCTLLVILCEYIQEMYIVVIISVGVAFSSSCTPCRAGTYSQGGARSCLECPENHFSERESHYCTPCNNITEFSPRASPTCLTRRLCTHNDYYETRTPCDSNNQVTYVISVF